ncbi:RING finger protein 122 isoform X2 [Bos javanicus]|uniref:RING finger protein 122 isoform X2 n=1 Tax=Bos javanicus TaxID=9906 RepID=UPI002AA751F0|nr:RING finger protein 122 isoform X2 [Bos javanicus]
MKQCMQLPGDRRWRHTQDLWAMLAGGCKSRLCLAPTHTHTHTHVCTSLPGCRGGQERKLYKITLSRKLRNQAQSERYGYKEVVLKGDAKKLQLYGTCAVCLEDFRGKDELGVLPCQHAFHRKCLVKWLEVRCVCPMCNKPIAGPSEASQSIGILLDELV